MVYKCLEYKMKLFYRNLAIAKCREKTDLDSIGKFLNDLLSN